MHPCSKKSLRRKLASAAAFAFFLSTNIHHANGQAALKLAEVHSLETNGVNISSPSASVFAEYVVNPVGYHTGIPQISVPLYTVKLKNLSLPISLNYHAGGLKVEEASSNVGLGWSLSAGGVITRAIKDKADDNSTQSCADAWNHIFGSNDPPIDGFTYCGNGLLHALSAFPNDNYDGITSYNIDLSGFNGLPGQASYSVKLLKKFYGVAIRNSKELWLLPMADKEPDIYYFNFAGRTGQFVFDVSTGTPKVKMFPHQDLEVTHIIQPGSRLSGFQIIDEQGIKYFFSDFEVTETSFRTNDAQVDVITADMEYQVKAFDTGSGHRESRSSWFLTRIETPSGEYLDFYYDQEEYEIAYRGPQQTGTYYIRPPAGSLAYNPNDLDYDANNQAKGYYNSLISNDAFVTTKRLSRIENNEIRIEFKSEADREDLVPLKRTITTPSGPQTFIPHPPKALTEVILHNKIGGENRVKKFKLAYDYFLSSTTETINPVFDPGPLIDRYKITVKEQERYYKRLRLLSVQEFGKDDNAVIPPYTFEYKYADFTGNATHVLPHRLSFQQDLWGYYNGASGNKTLIPALYVYPTHYPVKDSRQFTIYRKNVYNGAEYFMSGANRLPDATLADIGILTKITYPTKGYTQYTFQPHTFRDDGEDYAGGGLRIASITKHDAENPARDIVYHYSYQNPDNTSSGVIISKPVFALRTTNLAPMVANDDSELAYKSTTTRYSVPQAPLASTNGSFVGYRRVTESIAGNGKTVYTYSMPASWHVQNDLPLTTPNGECDPLTDGHCDGLYEVTPVKDIFVSSFAANLNAASYNFSQNPALPNTFPFPDNPNYDWQRGHLLSEKYFSESNTLLKEVIYKYKNYFPSNATAPTNVYGYKISSHYPRLNNNLFPAAFAFRAVKYRILTGVAKVLESKKEILYDQADLSKSIFSEINYDYQSPGHPLATQALATDSRGRTIRNVSQYAEDLPGSELGSDLLRSAHIHNRILRQVTSVDNTPASKVETKYESRNSRIVPVSVSSFLRATNEMKKVAYDYDGNGNIVKVHHVFEENASGVATVEGAKKAYVWGYNNTVPVAVADNALSKDIFYTGFEDGEGNSDPDDCSSGHKSRKDGYSKSLINLTNGPYTLSYRLKSGSSWIPQTTNVSVSNGTYTISFSAQDQVDDVRFHPADASMVSYTYDPLTGMTSMTDPNQLTTFYEYDGLGRLALVKDDKGNLLKTYDYHYKGQE